MICVGHVTLVVERRETDRFFWPGNRKCRDNVEGGVGIEKGDIKNDILMFCVPCVIIQ
jgi:hypothetical protein